MRPLIHSADTKTDNEPAADSAGVRDADALVGRFLRSFQALIRAVRLYQRNHPGVTDSLESAHTTLCVLLEHAPELSIAAEHGVLLIVGRDGRLETADPRAELHPLRDALAGAGVHLLSFLPAVNLGELAQLVYAVDATCRVANAGRREPGAPSRDWPGWLAQNRIQGIRVNSRAERSEDTVLASLMSALLGLQPAADDGAEQAAEISADQVRTTLRFLATAGPQLDLAQRNSPQQAARAVHTELAGADARTQAQLALGAAANPPRPDDTPGSYLAHVSDVLAVEYARSRYLAGHARASEVRHLLLQLQAGQDRAAGAHQESQLESRVELFWNTLPARETTRVLASSEAWCVPIFLLRRYLDGLVSAADKRGAQASGREARRALADFARCLDSEEAKARRTVAAALIELSPLIERLWPSPQLADLGRRVVMALARETSPGIAGLLTAVTENLTRLALANAHYAEIETILNGLDLAPSDAGREHIPALSRRIVGQDRWLTMMDVALANRHLDPALPRLLRRDPERLIERLALLLNSPEGSNALPAMARLVRAAGEPVIGSLEANLREPKRQRVATAIKLLAAVAPERLAAALPLSFSGWEWNLQDLAVTELTRIPVTALRTQVAQVLLGALTEAHLIVVPGMLDHIALAGEDSAVPRLIEIAAGKVERLRDVFIRIKAVETLGRLGADDSAPTLREIVRQRSGLTYVEPAGLRSVAEETLELLEKTPGAIRRQGEKEPAEKYSAAFPRPRRYPRINLSSPLAATVEESPAASAFAARVRTLSLGGAWLETSSHVAAGDSIQVEIHSGIQRIRSTAIVRNVSTTGCGIEFVHMTQDDREKLRRRIAKLTN